MLCGLVTQARNETGVEIPGFRPPCRLHIEDTSRCALATVSTANGAPVRLESGFALLAREAIEALGDLERCIAWAWMDHRGSDAATTDS